MNDIIDRKVDLTELSAQIAVMCAELASAASAQLLWEPDAFVTAQGLGEHFRVTRTIRAWLASPRPDALLIIAGSSRADDQLRAFVEMTPKNMVDVFGLPKEYVGEIGGRIIIQPHAVNTPDQTNWIASVLDEREVGVAAHAVTWYHQLRNYGTLLASQRRLETLGDTWVVPRMMHVPPRGQSPLHGTPFGDAHSGEVARLLNYIPTGDVIAPVPFKQYIADLYDEGVIGHL